jgi:hypothetical protein
MDKKYKRSKFLDHAASGAAEYLMTLTRDQMKNYLETIQFDSNDEKLNNLHKIALEKEYYEICAEIKKILENKEN